MRMVKLLSPLVLIANLFSALAYSQTPDRITGPIDSSRMVPLFANMQAPSRLGSDLGRADGGRPIEGISLDFRLSPAQQKDMDQFLAELGDRSSPNYHKYLKIPQYARRFGMSQNDVDKIVAWIESQGFTTIKVSPTRNKISFDGTVAQIESAFALEMHYYLVDGEVHLANAMNPSLPAALAGAVQHVGHLQDFPPKPRLKVKPNLTSYVSGNHYLTPADFATIYDLNALYTAKATGSNQKIAIVGQSTISTTDLNNFRSAAGLSPSTVNLQLVGGTSTRCSGDEGESDLDVEWSGGVAKGAQIYFVYAGVDAGRTCSTRINNVWDALEFALTGSATQGVTGTPVAPFVSTSYGYCEQLMQAQDPGFAALIQGWVQTGQTLGVTLVSASGDSGAADCDPSSSTSASHGFAVDVPASIPETTGAGGNIFSADDPTYTTPNPPGGDSPYWAPAGATSDTVSSALEYIPESAWNDTLYNIAHGGGFGASGGGASVGPAGGGFAKPTWQTGTGVPPDGKRDVPDISIDASADHDGYLFCSEDDQQTGGIVSTCTSGFRTGAGGNFTVVGGTSAAAPTFTAIMALVNQYLGNAAPTGLAPINPMLYSLYPNNATSKAFHDITAGNNDVPCTTGTTNCPSGTTEFGFNAGPGYDQVTGLGSVDGFNLAQAWAATLAGFSLAPSPASLTAVAGQNSGSTTITITPQNGFNGTVTFTCSAGLPSGATCVFTTVNATSSTLVIQTTANMAAVGPVAVTVKGTSGAVSSTTTVNLTITATTESFSLTSSAAGSTLSVSQGGNTTPANIALTSTSTPSFIVTSGTSSSTALPVSYSCSGLPSESTCIFSPTSPSNSTSISFTIKTTAPTAELRRPFDRGTRILYAALLPGLFGIMFTAGSRKRRRGMRLLGLIMVLGFSTLWLGSCSNSSGSGNSNPGTPTGTSTVTVNGTTGGSAPISSSFTFQLTVN
jgi:Pro-kumamolisin, activation domain